MWGVRGESLMVKGREGTLWALVNGCMHGGRATAPALLCGPRMERRLANWSALATGKQAAKHRGKPAGSQPLRLPASPSQPKQNRPGLPAACLAQWAAPLAAAQAAPETSSQAFWEGRHLAAAGVPGGAMPVLPLLPHPLLPQHLVAAAAKRAGAAGCCPLPGCLPAA